MRFKVGTKKKEGMIEKFILKSCRYGSEWNWFGTLSRRNQDGYYLMWTKPTDQ
jgi:hypothetical protein